MHSNNPPSGIFYCHVIHCYADMLKSDPWVSLRQVQDPELVALAESLPDTVLNARADSTTRKYICGFNRWKAWADKKVEIANFPVESTHLALYLQHVANNTRSKAAVEEAVNAISWVHKVAGIPSPDGAPLVKMALNGLQRCLARPKLKKKPVTVEMLQEIVASMSSNPTLAEVRLSTICLLAFAAFLRFDEISKLRCSDLQFQASYVLVKIQSSKTDQFRQGDEVLIASTGSSTCPVSMLELYIRLASIDVKSSQKLFRGLVHTKKGTTLRKNGSISYTRLKELVKEKLSLLGYDNRLYGLHSFRAGGATAAANASVKDRLFKRHGRWRSETAKDGYIEDSVAERLIVSQSLGL